MNFDQVAGAQPLAPSCTIVVPPTVFKDDWKGRPSSDLCCGIRSLGMDDIASLRKSAAQEAFALFPNDADEALRAETYDDALMRLFVARSTCDANNVNEPWEIWQGAPEDMSKIALSPQGTKRLFAEIERASVSLCAALPQADDEDLEELAESLSAGMPELTGERSARARRLLFFVLEQIRADAL